VGAAQKEIQIGHPVRHDQEHHRARRDERENESELGAPGKLRRLGGLGIRLGPAHMVLRVINLSVIFHNWSKIRHIKITD